MLGLDIIHGERESFDLDVLRERKGKMRLLLEALESWGFKVGQLM